MTKGRKKYSDPKISRCEWSHGVALKSIARTAGRCSGRRCRSFGLSWQDILSRGVLHESDLP